MAGSILSRTRGARMLACGVAVAVLGASNAYAVPVLFSLSDGLSFTVDSNPTVSNVIAGKSFQTTTSYGLSTFGNPSALGGFSFSANDGLHTYTGDKLYSGTEAAPVFSFGTYTLNNTFEGPVIATVSAAPGAPGPLLGGGLLSAMAGGLGLLMTRRRRVSVSFASA